MQSSFMSPTQPRLDESQDVQLQDDFFVHPEDQDAKEYQNDTRNQGN